MDEVLEIIKKEFKLQIGKEKRSIKEKSNKRDYYIMICDTFESFEPIQSLIRVNRNMLINQSKSRKDFADKLEAIFKKSTETGFLGQRQGILRWVASHKVDMIPDLLKQLLKDVMGLLKDGSKATETAIAGIKRMTEMVGMRRKYDGVPDDTCVWALIIEVIQAVDNIENDHIYSHAIMKLIHLGYSGVALQTHAEALQKFVNECESGRFSADKTQKGIKNSLVTKFGFDDGNPISLEEFTKNVVGPKLRVQVKVMKNSQANETKKTQLEQAIDMFEEITANTFKSTMKRVIEYLSEPDLEDLSFGATKPKTVASDIIEFYSSEFPELFTEFINSVKHTPLYEEFNLKLLIHTDE